MTATTHGPIEEYLQVREIPLDAFYRHVKAGDPAAVQVLCGELLYRKLQDIGEAIDLLGRPNRD